MTAGRVEQRARAAGAGPSVPVRAELLRYAVMAMVNRYGQSQAEYAYAVMGGKHADERRRLLNRMGWQFKATQRLARALANLAGER